MPVKYRLALGLFLFWLLPALACSLSTGAAPPSGGLGWGSSRPSNADLFSTAIALTATPASLEPQAPPGDPLPGLTTPAVPLTGTPPAGAAPPPAAVLHISGDNYVYPAQSGDTLQAVARRFGVQPEQIASDQDLPSLALLQPGQVLTIPNVVQADSFPAALLPDSEIIYSPSAAGFDTQGFIEAAGGYLSGYTEIVDGELLAGSEIVRRIATETSTNPRLLLSFLEHRSGWVLGQPVSSEIIRYPIGFYVPGYQGLYKELSLTAKQLATGYYGWRSGTLTELKFPDGSSLRLAPGLNAGAVSILYLFAQFHSQEPGSSALYGPTGFIQTHWRMFEDPWQRAAAVEPLLPAGIVQPGLELPFNPGERWSFTGGPHISWLTGTPRGALDFAPVTGEAKCAVSSAWVTASAPGVAARSERSVVVIDLDGDGYEQTGWSLVYMHVAERDRIHAGEWVDADAPLGHPSCEGGVTTGTHVHIARKYNGEWIAADGPLPFILSGWRVIEGTRPFEGLLVKGEQTVSARPDGSHSSGIIRGD